MKHTLTLLTTLLLTPLAALHAADAPAQKPNIIVILADDLGWGDVGFNGCREIPTPHLDALTKAGVRFTSGYASHPYCRIALPGLAALLLVAQSVLHAADTPKPNIVFNRAIKAIHSLRINPLTREIESIGETP